MDDNEAAPYPPLFAPGLQCAPRFAGVRSLRRRRRAAAVVRRLAPPARRHIARDHGRKVRSRLRSSGTLREEGDCYGAPRHAVGRCGPTGAVAIELPPAAQVLGRHGPSSPAVAGPSVAQKSALRPLCDGKRLRCGKRARRQTSIRKDRLVGDRGCPARFVDHSSRFFDGPEAFLDHFAPSFPGPVLLPPFPLSGRLPFPSSSIFYLSLSPRVESREAE